MFHNDAGSSKSRLSLAHPVLSSQNVVPASPMNAALSAKISNVANVSEAKADPWAAVALSPTVKATSSPEDFSTAIGLGKKRVKREGPSEERNDLNRAARTLAFSLAKVVRNASDSNFTYEALQILGVTDAGKSLEETLYSCTFAQMSIAALKAQSKYHSTDENASILESIPAGSPMDKELQGLSREATQRSGSGIHLLSSVSKADCKNFIAFAQPNENVVSDKLLESE